MTLKIKNEEEIRNFLKKRIQETRPKMIFFGRRIMIVLLKNIDSFFLKKRGSMNYYLCIRIRNMIRSMDFWKNVVYCSTGDKLIAWIHRILGNYATLHSYLNSLSLIGDAEYCEASPEELWPYRLILIELMLEELERKD